MELRNECLEKKLADTRYKINNSEPKQICEGDKRDVCKAESSGDCTTIAIETGDCMDTEMNLIISSLGPSMNKLMGVRKFDEFH